MPATVSLTLQEFHPGVKEVPTPGWISLSSILRTESFKKIAETITVFGLFGSLIFLTIILAASY